MNTIWLYSTITTIIYSIVYGLYEYFILYHFGYIKYLEKPVNNWIIMYSIFVILLLLVCRKKIKVSIIVFSVILFAILEDIVFWVSSSAIKPEYSYPFPVGDWFSSTYSTFKIFDLGKGMEIFPFFPMFYIYGFVIRIVYDIIMIFDGLNHLERPWTILTCPVLISILTTSIIIQCDENTNCNNIDFNTVFFTFISQIISMYIATCIFYFVKNKYSTQMGTEPVVYELQDIETGSQSNTINDSTMIAPVPTKIEINNKYEISF